LGPGHGGSPIRRARRSLAACHFTIYLAAHVASLFIVLHYLLRRFAIYVALQFTSLCKSWRFANHGALYVALVCITLGKNLIVALGEIETLDKSNAKG